MVIKKNPDPSTNSELDKYLPMRVKTDYSIENCASVLKCPRHLQALLATDNPARRFCNTRDQTVHFCDDDESLNRHLQAGDCVAVRAANKNPETYYVGSKTGAGYDASSRVTKE